MTCSASAWRQTSSLFMPEEEKGPQFPSASFGCLHSACTSSAVESLTADVLNVHVTALLRPRDLYRKI